MESEMEQAEKIIVESADDANCKSCKTHLSDLKHLAHTEIRGITAEVFLGICDNCWLEDIIYIRTPPKLLS